jgi:hypothetical protein
MLRLDPQRVAELQRRLAARELRAEDFQMLPDLLASFRELAQWLSEEDLTEERLQALLLGTGNEAAEAAHGERAKSPPPRPGQPGRSAVERRSRNRRA